jgi:transcriptional regulator with XRE-family HTH domain
MQFKPCLRHGEPEPGVTLPSGWRERLRQAIRESGKKQAAVAREAGMTPESVCRILSAQHVRPSFESIARIARAAGVDHGGAGVHADRRTAGQGQDSRVLLLNLTGGLPK